MKLVQSIKNGYYWSKALQASSRDRHEEAYHLLDKCIFHDYEFWIFKTFLLFAMSRDSEAKNASKKASELLEHAKIPLNDKAYLVAFLLNIKSKVEGTDYDISKVKLEQVSKHHLNNFPLRGHPEWSNI